jgi:hypothetical protein
MIYMMLQWLTGLSVDSNGDKKGQVGFEIAKRAPWKKLQKCLGQNFGFRRCDFGNKRYTNSGAYEITSLDTKTFT